MFYIEVLLTLTVSVLCDPRRPPRQPSGTDQFYLNCKISLKVYQPLLSFLCKNNLWADFDKNVQFRPHFLGGFGVIISQKIDGSICS